MSERTNAVQEVDTSKSPCDNRIDRVMNSFEVYPRLTSYMRKYASLAELNESKFSIIRVG